jgi:hypothetical protein
MRELLDPAVKAGDDMNRGRVDMRGQVGMAGLEPGRLRAHIRHQASDSATILAMVRLGANPRGRAPSIIGDQQSSTIFVGVVLSL